MTITAFLPLERTAFATPDLFAEPLASWLPGARDGAWCTAGPVVEKGDTWWRSLRWVSRTGRVRTGRVGLRVRNDNGVLVFRGEADAEDAAAHTDAATLLQALADGLDRALVARIEAAKRRHPSAGRAG